MSRTRYTMAFDAHNMVPGPAARSTVQVLWRTEDGVTDCYGTGAAPTTANTYAEGCIYRKFVSAGASIIYYNYGTYASPDFEALLDVNNVINQIEAEHLAAVADDNGPSPLIWDDAPLLEVLLNPGKGYYYFNDFDKGNYAGTHGAGTFVITYRSSGSVANNATDQGGACTMDAGAATTGQGITAQLATIGIKPEANTTIRIEWRCKIDEDTGHIAMGLGAVGTTSWCADAAMETAADMAMLFRDGDTGATDWSYSHSDGSSVQTEDDVFTGSDAGYETFGIVIVGDGTQATDSITYYRNGVASGAAATDVSDMPDAIMVPTFEVGGDNTDQPVLVLDWLRILVSNSVDGSRA